MRRSIYRSSRPKNASPTAVYVESVLGEAPAHSLFELLDRHHVAFAEFEQCIEQRQHEAIRLDSATELDEVVERRHRRDVGMCNRSYGASDVQQPIAKPGCVEIL